MLRDPAAPPQVDAGAPTSTDPHRPPRLGGRQELEGLHPFPPGPAMETIQALHAHKLGILQGFDKGVREQHEIACKAGCGGCCHQAVLVQPYEAAALAATLPRDLLMDVIEQGLRQAAVFKGNYCSEELAAEWSQQGEDCALLKDGSCAAYMVRPAACGLLLTPGPAELCAAGNVERIDATPEIREAANLEREWSGTPRWELMGVAIMEALTSMETIPARS